MDLVDGDVAVAAGRLVDDFDHRLTVTEPADIPALPIEERLAVVRTHGGADGLAADHQVDAGPLRVAAAGDEEVEVAAPDPERRRGEPAACLVAAAVEAVNQSLALEPLEPVASGGIAADRCRPERVALDLPSAEVGLLEVGDEDFVRGGRCDGQQAGAGKGCAEGAGRFRFHGWFGFQIEFIVWTASDSTVSSPPSLVIETLPSGRPMSARGLVL
jgi:hypothetical protein